MGGDLVKSGDQSLVRVSPSRRAMTEALTRLRRTAAWKGITHSRSYPMNRLGLAAKSSTFPESAPCTTGLIWPATSGIQMGSFVTRRRFA